MESTTKHYLNSLSGLPRQKALSLMITEMNRRRNLATYQAMAAEASRKDTSLTSYRSSLDNPEDPFYHLLHTTRVASGKKARWKVYYGGRGGRKTWQIAEAIIRRMLRDKTLVLCGREYQNSIADSVHRILVNTIERLDVGRSFIVTQSSIRHRTNGSEVIYKGLHNAVTEIKSTEDVDIVWLEEGQSLSKLTLQTIGPTIRKPGSEIWISFNPKNRLDPVYQRFIVVGDPDAIVVKVNWDTNPHFTEELESERQQALRAIAEADNDEERKQAQSDYSWIWDGELHDLANEIVYAGKWIVEAFDDDLYKKAPRVLFGQDFGFAQDPMALVRMFILDRDLYIEYEAGGTQLDFLGNMRGGVGELEQVMLQIPESKIWPIKADSARPETISFLRGVGFNVSAAEKWQGSVEDGITHIRGFRKIIVHPRCKNVIYEFQNYKYKVDRITGEVLPILIDKNNHYMDSIRYGLDGYIQRRGDVGIWSRFAAQTQGG